MPASATTVTLPKYVVPEFPDECIVCHETPDSTTKITQNSMHWWLVVFMPILLLFGWSRVEVPICRSCKPRFYMQRWGRTLLCWAIVFAVISLAWPYFEGWSRLTKKLAILGLALVALVPYGVLEVFWPRSFDTTASGDKVDYEFRSES